MSKRPIRFNLVYRDMFQSSGKYQPRADQLKRIAPVIVEMGCFDRVETNGGAFEQVNLLYGENPNHAVRTFTKPFKEAGIQTEMLDRALNGLRMYPVPADVRRLMYKVKKAQGVDIPRIFDGLNDVRNIIPSIEWAKEAGMIPQATLCITHSPVHTVDYYLNIATQLIEAGAPEICLKDMAGVGRPVTLGQITKAIKDRFPHIIVEYHGHTGPGFSVASMLEVARAGADILDVSMEPISWGKIHPDVITVAAMLEDAGFEVPKINMDAYMHARALTQEFMDDFLGFFMDENNFRMSSLLVGCGLPGGMMGSMMADLTGVLGGINMYHKQNGNPELSVDDLLVKLFTEVEYVWPRVGYPPLVTPYSQYVKNIALMNVFNMERGGERWQSIDQNTWDMIRGKAGRLPGTLDPEIEALAKANNQEFVDADPKDNYPDELDKFRKEMVENGWDFGPDDEELFEFAMHERQYRDYKSGVAKERFEKDLIRLRDEKLARQKVSAEDLKAIKRAKYVAVTAPASGQVFWEVDLQDRSVAPSEGTPYRTGEQMCFVMTPMGYQEKVIALVSGRIREVVIPQGGLVQKGEVIAYMDEVTEALPMEEGKESPLRPVETMPYEPKKVIKPQGKGK